MSTNFRPLRNIRKRPAAVPKEKEKYEAIEGDQARAGGTAAGQCSEQQPKR